MRNLGGDWERGDKGGLDVLDILVALVALVALVVLDILVALDVFLGGVLTFEKKCCIFAEKLICWNFRL